MGKNCDRIIKHEDGKETMVDVRGRHWPQHMANHTCDWAKFACGHCDQWGHGRKECKFWVAKTPAKNPGNGSGSSSDAKRDTGREMQPDLNALLAQAEQEQHLADHHAQRHAEILVDIQEILDAQKAEQERVTESVKKLFEAKKKKDE